METDYITRRLALFRSEAINTARVEVGKILVTAAAVGRSNSSYALQSMEAAARKIHADALKVMLAFVSTRASEGREERAKLLDTEGRMLADGLADLMAERTRGDGLRFSEHPNQGASVEALRNSLNIQVDQSVDDFRRCNIGDNQLGQVSKLEVNVGSVEGHFQLAVGSHNQLTAQQNSVADAVNAILASPEVSNLPEVSRLKVLDLGEVLKGEATKPVVDKSKLARWGGELLKCLRDVGIEVAATALAKALSIG